MLPPPTPLEGSKPTVIYPGVFRDSPPCRIASVGEHPILHVPSVALTLESVNTWALSTGFFAFVSIWKFP